MLSWILDSGDLWDFTGISGIWLNFRDFWDLDLGLILKVWNRELALILKIWDWDSGLIFTKSGIWDPGTPDCRPLVQSEVDQMRAKAHEYLFSSFQRQPFQTITDRIELPGLFCFT